MRSNKFGSIATAFVIAASSSFVAAPSVLADAGFLSADGYANDEMNAGDWSKAEAALLGNDVAAEDAVFTKINLAFVYSSTGRRRHKYFAE